MGSVRGIVGSAWPGFGLSVPLKVNNEAAICIIYNIKEHLIQIMTTYKRFLFPQHVLLLKNVGCCTFLVVFVTLGFQPTLDIILEDLLEDCSTYGELKLLFKPSP